MYSPGMSLDDLARFEWYSWFPLATILFLVVAVVVMRSAHLERRRVLRLAALYCVAIAAMISAGAFSALGVAKGDEYATETAIIVSGVCLILVSSIFVFRVASPRLGLHPPRILQDVLVVVALVVFGLAVLAWRNEVNPTNLFTTSALITAVVALSLQDTLGNILGGLALQLDRSIQVGDWIRLDQLTGRVVEIGWRQTSIETNDWETIVVPNSVLVKNRFLVLGRRTGKPLQHRRWVPFYVDASNAPDGVIDAVQRSIRAMDLPNVARDPAAQCFLLELAENPARYAVSYWLTDLTAMNPTDSSIRVQTYLALQRSGISVAVPSRTIAMTKDSKQKRQMRRDQDLAQRMMALRTVDIFRGFGVDELNQLADRLQPAPYLANDVLVRQGAEAVRLYIIVEGRADVFVQTDSGERAKVAELGPGDFFGEMGLLTGEPRTATVVAKSKMLCYRLGKDSFRDLIVARPDAAEQISTILAKRRAELDATRENLDAETTAARTAATRHVIRQKIWQFFGLED
jgi:small-conductance mechanosensitive channel/CRP-like cAMP-binding protein